MSRADTSVVLHEPTATGRLSVSPQILIMRLIDADPPLARWYVLGDVVVAVADHDAQLLAGGRRLDVWPFSAARRR